MKHCLQKRIISRAAAWGCAVFALSVVQISCVGPDKESIVARVNGEILTRQELDRQMTVLALRPDQEHEYVDRWINDQLLYQEARHQGLEKSKDLDEELERVKREFVIQKLLEKTFAEKINITEEEINSYYHNNTDLFKVLEDEVLIYHILTNTRAEANVALQELRAGKQFKEVAEQRSTGPFASSGGDMGYLKKGDVIPEVARYAFRLSPGSLSTVFKSSHGYHIVKVIKKRDKDSVKNLEDVRDEIAQRIRVTKERSVYYDLLFRLQHSENISIHMPNAAELEKDADTTLINDR